jgi:Icc-related predicted phosphoesterase
MQRLLITTDLHQRRGKWEALVESAESETPAFILVAGDILPKDGGFTRQREFFPQLRKMLQAIRDRTGARVLLYLANDDGHFLEPLVNDLASDGLCVNLNQRVHREGGLVFCGMNKVRDYPFGYKHYCVPDEGWATDPVQYCNPAMTFDDKGNEIAIPDLRRYLLNKRSILRRLEDLKVQLQPGEIARSVWVVHQPPAGLGMDICGDGRRVGSPALTRFIEENQPLLGCSGHIHESPHQPGGRWIAHIGRTPWVQSGQVDRRLHYVTLDIADDYACANAWHNVFGAAGEG